MDTQEIRLIRNWWLLAIKGLLTLVFGVVALTFPDINQIKIIKYFCAIISASGVLLIAGGIFNITKHFPWKWWVIEGLFDLVIGLIIFWIITDHRIAAIAMFTEIIATWSLVFGIIQIITAFRFNRYSLGWFAMLISGLLAVSFTAIILLNILPGTHAKTVVIGYFAIFLGFVILLNSNKLRRTYSDKSE
jgi:uncharacterized membrane protein HdeD (DUF308 family)